ncbi:MAG: DUF4258 domain-containing protein [Anaerolineales bacterium]|nr:DUF4258 domain-containing protein [Anaerolineales bacterium]
MAVRFTQHARDKFALLARHGFLVTEEQVVATLVSPDKIDYDLTPPVAQKALTERHVLRVVFREEQGDLVVVTFYPGRRQRYED